MRRRKLTKQIGMSRNISLDYLDKTVDLMNTEVDFAKVRRELKKFMAHHIDTATNRRKTVNILNNIWLKDTVNDKKIKDYARQIVKTNNDNLKLVSHWCMMLISYNIFKDMSFIIGKLEYMQIELASRIIREKMIDLWGDRPTLIHAIPKNIRTMRDVGVLEPLSHGVYKVKKHQVKDPRATILIAATLIYLKDKLYLIYKELVNDHLMFPFIYNIDLEMLEDSDIFIFDRFGGELTISLKES